MRAGLVHQADLALAVAERDQVLAQQAHPMRLAVALDIGGREEGDPVQPHELAHRGTGADANERLVVLGIQHGLLG